MNPFLLTVLIKKSVCVCVCVCVCVYIKRKLKTHFFLQMFRCLYEIFYSVYGSNSLQNDILTAIIKSKLNEIKV